MRKNLFENKMQSRILCNKGQNFEILITPRIHHPCPSGKTKGKMRIRCNKKTLYKNSREE